MSEKLNQKTDKFQTHKSMPKMVVGFASILAFMLSIDRTSCSSFDVGSDYLSPSYVFNEKDLLSSYDNDSVPPSNIVSSCIAFMHLYSDAAANFTKCANGYARPLRFCENCVHEFVKAKAVYDFIIKGHSRDTEGRPCSDVILNADRTQILVQTNRYIMEIWDGSYCKNCFEVYHDDNGTTVARLNNDTLHFLTLINRTDKCFEKFTKGENILPLGNATVNHTICTVCKDFYDKLNDHYKNMNEHFDKHVCMDVVDTMNYTRLMWSKTFHCSRQTGDMMAVLLLSGLFATLPIVFYLGNRIYGQRRQTKLLRQKRLRDAPIPANNSVVSINDSAVPGSSSEVQD